MFAHVDSEDLQQAGCSALAWLAEQGPAGRGLGIRGFGVEAVVAGMNAHQKSANVQGRNLAVEHWQLLQLRVAGKRVVRQQLMAEEQLQSRPHYAPTAMQRQYHDGVA